MREVPVAEILDANQVLAAGEAPRRREKRQGENHDREVQRGK